MDAALPRAFDCHIWGLVVVGTQGVWTPPPPPLGPFQLYLVPSQDSIGTLYRLLCRRWVFISPSLCSYYLGTAHPSYPPSSLGLFPHALGHARTPKRFPEIPASQVLPKATRPFHVSCMACALLLDPASFVFVYSSWMHYEGPRVFLGDDLLFSLGATFVGPACLGDVGVNHITGVSGALLSCFSLTTCSTRALAVRYFVPRPWRLCVAMGRVTRPGVSFLFSCRAPPPWLILDPFYLLGLPNIECIEMSISG